MLRKQLSDKLREMKKQSGMKYDDILKHTTVGKTTLCTALNGGEAVSLESFDSLFAAVGAKVCVDAVMIGDKSDDKA